MGAAARKPASTAPDKAQEGSMSVASAFRGNAGLQAQAQGADAARQKHGRAQGILSDDSEPPVSARSDTDRRAPNAANSTPDKSPTSAAKAQARTDEKVQLTPASVLESSEDILEEFDSDIDLDDDPTTQSISILRRTGAQINMQNQQLEREVELLRQQLEELEKLEQEVAIRSPVKKAWHNSGATPSSSRNTPSKLNQPPDLHSVKAVSPYHRRSLTGGHLQTPSSTKSSVSLASDRSGDDKAQARKSTALRGVNDKRRHTYHQHRSSTEPRTHKSPTSASELKAAEASPLKQLDMRAAIAEEMKGSPTDRTELRLSESTDTGLPDSTVNENDVRAWSNTLAHKWVEVELLLRRPITCDEDITYTMAAGEAGLLFMDQLDRTAKSLNCLRGTISRWILPYDASTSVADQSSMIRQVLDSTPEDLKGRLSEKHISYLVAGANSVRKLVRVKIADDNDLEQARLAVTTTLDFFQRLQQYANRVGLSPYEALQENVRTSM